MIPEFMSKNMLVVITGWLRLAESWDEFSLHSASPPFQEKRLRREIGRKEKVSKAFVKFRKLKQF